MIVFTYIKTLSERAPGKNFRELGGEPLWRRMLLKCVGHQVFVDTDSDEILERCAREPALAHVTAYRRLDEHVRSGETMDMIRRFFEERYTGSDPVAILHATTPFLRIGSVEGAARQMVSGGFDSALSATMIRNFAFRRVRGGRWAPLNHDNRHWPRTQDMEPIAVLNHCFYVVLRETVMRLRHRVGDSPLMVPLEFPESADIDWEEDWQLVKALYAAGVR